MSVGSINVNLATLREASSRMQIVEEACGEIKCAIEKVDDMTEGVWTGKARETFCKKCQGIAVNAEKLSGRVNLNRIKLDEIIENYIKEEASNTERINDIYDPGNIFA